MYLLIRNGIYYYQRVTMCNGRCQTFRKSLKTRDRAKAQLLALQIHFNHSSPVQQAACISDAACRDVMSKPVGFEAEASTTQHPPLNGHVHIPACTGSPSGVESPAVPSEHNQIQPDQEEKFSGHVESYIAEKQLSWALNRPYFPRHLKSLKLRSFRRCYEQAAALHGRIQTGRRQAGD